MSDDTADTIPAPNANTGELARELEKLAFKHQDDENESSWPYEHASLQYWLGWKQGVRDAAEHVRSR